MTLEMILSTIQNIDEISVQDCTGVLYYGVKGNFKPSKKLLNKTLDCIRAFNSCVILLLN